MLVPLFSVDAAFGIWHPLLIALLSQGRSALSVTLRYVLAQLAFISVLCSGGNVQRF